MLQVITERITEQFVQNGIVKENEKEIYAYGIRNGIVLFANILVVLAFGLVLSDVAGMLFFIVSYQLLRSYAGGFHLSTHARCFLFSIPMYGISAWMIRFTAIPLYMTIFVLLGAGVVFFMLAPVEHKNKPLDRMERKVYGKRAKGIFLILAIITFILRIKGIIVFANAGLLAVVLTSVFMIAGKVWDGE